MPIRLIALAAASCLVHGVCYAESADDTLSAATAHYTSIIYSTVASRISSDIEKALLTDKQVAEWLEAIVNSLAACHLEALAYLGRDVQDETIRALASGADKATISQVISKHMRANPSFHATLAEYSNARDRCTVLLNQEYGINYY